MGVFNRDGLVPLAVAAVVGIGLHLSWSAAPWWLCLAAGWLAFVIVHRLVASERTPLKPSERILFEALAIGGAAAGGLWYWNRDASPWLYIIVGAVVAGVALSAMQRSAADTKIIDGE